MKKEWEVGRLMSEKEEEEKRAASLEKEKETLVTCHRDDAYNQVKNRSKIYLENYLVNELFINNINKVN